MRDSGTAMVTTVSHVNQDDHIVVELWATDMESSGKVPHKIEVHNSSFSDWGSLSCKVPLTITDTHILIGDRQIARRSGKLVVVTSDAPEIIKESVQAYYDAQVQDPAEPIEIKTNIDPDEMAKAVFAAMQKRLAEWKDELAKKVEEKFKELRGGSAAQAALRDAICNTTTATEERVQSAASSCCGNASSATQDLRQRSIFVTGDNLGNACLNQCLQKGAVVDIAACSSDGVLVILEWPADEAE